MSNNQPGEGRPVEIHVTTVDTIDRDAMPLISSLAFGERHSSQMINLSNKGMVPAGFINGFVPSPAGGLRVRISPDSEGDGNAVVVLDGGMPLRIFQQHEVELEMIPGVKNYIVLEGFYEEGVLTTQVSADSTKEPARLRRLISEDMVPSHLIVCEVDLTDGTTEITNDKIDLSNRPTSALDWKTHESAENPHPQYIKVDNGRITSDLKFADNVKLIFGDDDDFSICYDGSKTVLEAPPSGVIEIKSEGDVKIQIDMATGAISTDGDITALSDIVSRVSVLENKDT